MNVPGEPAGKVTTMLAMEENTCEQPPLCTRARTCHVPTVLKQQLLGAVVLVPAHGVHVPEPGTMNSQRTTEPVWPERVCWVGTMPFAQVVMVCEAGLTVPPTVGGDTVTVADAQVVLEQEVPVPGS
jgi:hypothetical protein